MRNAEGAPEYAIATVQDITERKQAEARIQRLAHLYAALSECNQSIVRCSSSEALFPQVCRLAVEFGGMKMAWVGLIDPETQQVKPVASFGDATNYLQDVVVSADPEDVYKRQWFPWPVFWWSRSTDRRSSAKPLRIPPPSPH